MAREKSMSPEKVKKTSVTVKKVSTVERKGITFWWITNYRLLSSLSFSYMMRT